ncbi:hypothetical protein N0V90_003171 [Kalmusia sp. IMI 367209]|nr:hypothetical protein N0V90_003171 [Kalmusia sp. IMI 367209]
MDANLRLPSLRDLMAVDTPPEVHASSFGSAHPHPQPQTSTSAAPMSNVSWTAINHRPARSGTTPPPPAQDTDAVSPSHRQDRSGNGSHHQHQMTATSSAALSVAEPKHGRVPFNGRSPRSPSGEHQTAGRPITAERQDSAVFAAAPSQTAAVLPPGNVSSHAGASPEPPYRAALRDAADHPVTPPPDTTLAQAHATRVSSRSTMHDVTWDSPFANTRQEAEDPCLRPRERSRSDATGSSTMPLPQTALFVNGKNNMPPPPVPAPAPALSPTCTTIESSILSLDLISSHSTPKYPPDPSNTEKDDVKITMGPEKCVYCHDAWTFPLPDTVTEATSKNDVEMSRNMDAYYRSLANYRRRKAASYREWAQRHRTESGATILPCIAAQERLSMSPKSGNKRKPDASRDDASPPTKSRKLSCDSPPQPVELTPPPEQAISSISTNGSATTTQPFSTDTSFLQQTASGRFFHQEGDGAKLVINSDVARILGKPGAPRSQYEPPPNDSSNMWHDAARKSKRRAG